MANSYPNSPNQKVSTAGGTQSGGRGSQLKYGPGQNQYVRASDFNPLVDYLNGQSGINASTQTVTQGTSITTAVTLNAPAGVITCFATSIATGTTQTFTLNNSYITANSIVFVMMNGTNAAANSAPYVASVVPAAGSATITLANGSATATGSNALKLSFIVF